MKPTLVLLAMMCVLGQVHAAQVNVAIAANFTKPMQDLAVKYEKATGDTLVMSFGATGALYAQIKNGAPFDVFLAADNKAPQRAVAEGYGVEGTTFTYAIGKLVLWSKDPQFVTNETTLKQSELKKLAIADAKLAPYGVAAEETLKKLGLYDALSSKFVVGGNIGQTYQFVSTGNAQAGFVALSQCFKDGKFTSGSGWIVPSEYYSAIRQDGVLLKNGSNAEAARRFIEYLKSSPEADHIRTAFGYDMQK